MNLPKATGSSKMHLLLVSFFEVAFERRFEKLKLIAEEVFRKGPKVLSVGAYENFDGCWVPFEVPVFRISFAQSDLVYWADLLVKICGCHDCK